MVSKKIILCADGTWNIPHGPAETPNDTNVRKLYLLLKEDPAQLKYYDSGVGTDGSPFEHVFGGAMGQGLFQKVQDGYAFLSYVWDPGDQIFLFGFSRGAYTARSLAGMIALFGVPTRNLDNLTVKSIFDVYRITDPDERLAKKKPLVEQYGLTDVTVQMVGVWDTVGALGIPGQLFSGFDEKQYGFLHTSLNPCIEHGYQALALDEQRAAFVPALWTNEDGTPRDNDAKVQQVWFPGVHSDVGGGYNECGLSNITLRWMLDNAEAQGLLFDEDAVETHFAPKPFLPLSEAHDSWSLLYGLPKHRTAPPNAVLANTVKLRATGSGYTSKALDEPVASYADALVIPASEL